MKFEYTVTSILGSSLMKIKAALSKFGADGWELVDIKWDHLVEEDGNIGGVFTLKRRSDLPGLTAEPCQGVPFIFPECERCWMWDIEIGGCAENVVKGESSEERCANWTFSKPDPAFSKPATERAEDPESAKVEPGDLKAIQPLLVDGVEICTGSYCEQFNVAECRCKLAGYRGDGAVCPVWYKFEDKGAPLGAARFIRELPEPDLDNNWEPLVRKVEELMDDFAHYKSHPARTGARRTVVEAVLRAIDDAGFRVIEKGERS